jgi:hypothetical protein
MAVKPMKGLCAFEWAMIAYAVLTLLYMLFIYTQLQNPISMIWLRVQAVAMTLGLWAVYRMIPCKLTMLFRVLGQIALLGTWYPETYEFNRILPNLDHVFATWEQQLFGYQPALLFSQHWDSPVVSELLTLGYVSYYPLIALVFVYYFIWCNDELNRAAFTIIASFFLFYIIFIFLPVAGPQYYYPAAGIDNIASGVFPAMGNYFETHQESLPIPGWCDGLFHQLVVDAHDAGERPTAAFPSSHVGVTVVLLWLAWRAGSPRLLWTMMPFAVLMFFATFYIQAHYAIDAIAGIAAGTLIYFICQGLFRFVKW